LEENSRHEKRFDTRIFWSKYKSRLENHKRGYSRPQTQDIKNIGKVGKTNPVLIQAPLSALFFYGVGFVI
jgi:hypothetical protein